jgi:multiple sugar transport system permease protein
MVMFVFYPLITAFYYSLHDLAYKEFVGLQNYREALFEDSRVQKSIRNTFMYLLIRVPTTIILGFWIANTLDKISQRGRSPLLAGFFAPYLPSLVAFAAVFMHLYASGGLFNAFLQFFGLPPQPFTRHPRQALASIALMDAWKHIGFDIVIFLAALQNIPKTLYEAATVDGASRWQLTRYITIPLLRPTFLYLTAVLSIWTLQVFEPIYVMTGAAIGGAGGPLDSTRTIVLTIYQAAFSSARIGYASAVSYVLFAIIFAITIVQLRVGITRWEY